MMTVIWSALALGSLYAMVAVLFNIGIAQSGRFNFAAPQAVMIGAFVTYVLTVSLSVPVWAAFLVAALLGGVVGYLVELLAIRFVPTVGHQTMVTTVGAAFFLEGMAFVIFGTDARRIPFFGGDESLDIAGGIVSPVDLALMASAVVLVAAMILLSRHTRWGLSSRAATADPDAAQLRGINVIGSRAVAFALSGAIGGAAGVLAGSKIFASYDMGILLLVYGFVALTLGGSGSYIGCLVGGVVVGAVQAFSARYVGGNYGLAFVFLLLILVLLVRPTGIFGARHTRTI